MIVTTPSEISEVLKEAFPEDIQMSPLWSHVTGDSGRCLKTPEFGLWRTDTEEYVSSRAVRKGYVPHQTSHVIEAASAASSCFTGPVQIDATFSGGHYVSIMPTEHHRKEIYGTKDNIFPRFQISAKYGSGAYRASLGLFRDACQNMQMLRSTSSKTSVIIRHDSFLEGNQEALVEQFSNLKSKWGTIVEAVEQMEATKINLKEFYHELRPISETDSENKKKRHYRMMEAIHSRIMQEKLDTERSTADFDWMVSGWEAWNGIQGYVQHQKSRKGSPTDFDRVISCNRDSLVKRAELLVLSLTA